MNRIKLFLVTITAIASLNVRAYTDITNQYLVNADLSTANTGWTYYPGASKSYTAWSTLNDDSYVPAVEFWEGSNISNFKFSQTITLPSGYYRIAVNAFYREGSSGNGTNADQAWIFAGENRQNVYALNSMSELRSYTGNSDMLRAQNAFKRGAYSNEFDFIITEDSKQIELGFEGNLSSSSSPSWCILGPVKLYEYTAADYKNDLDEKSADAITRINALTLSSAIKATYLSRVEAMQSASYNSVDEIMAAINSLTSIVTEATNLANTLSVAYDAYETAKASVNDVLVLFPVNGASDVIETQDAIVDAATTADEIYAAVQAVNDILTPYTNDVTSTYIANSSPYINGDGWTLNNTPTYDATNKCAEFWNKSGASIKQTIANLPAGIYRLTVIALQRTGMNGTIEANGKTINIAQVANSIVNSRSQANTWFDNGNGVNTIVFKIEEATNVTIGVTADVNNGDHWIVWRSFTLDLFSDAISLAQSKLTYVVSSAESLDGTIPSAAFDALMAVVTNYNKDYETASEYFEAVDAIQNAINLYASNEIKKSYASYYAKRGDVVAAKQTQGLTERTEGAFATFLNTINEADITVEAATTTLSIEEGIENLSSALKTLLADVIPAEGHPVDITTLLNNPDFEEGGELTTGILPGWECTFVKGEDATNIGLMIPYNLTYTNGDVQIYNYFIEAWRNRNEGETIGDGELYQRLSGLPVGKYRLTTDAISVNQFYDNWNPVTGVYIYIKSGEIETRTDIHTGNNLPEHFEVDFLNDFAESLDFGLKTESTTANWIAADNFHIYFTEALFESPGVAALKMALEQYEGVEFGPAKATLVETFNQELQKATQMSVTDIYSSTHSNECIAEITILEDAYAAVKASEEEYAGFQKNVNDLLTYNDSEWEDSPVRGEIDLLAEELQSYIDNGTAEASLFSNLSARADAIKTFWSTHLTEAVQDMLDNAAQKLGLSIEKYDITSGFVTSINLSNSGLTGIFPISAFDMPHLSNLDLSGNSISSVDAVWGNDVTVNLKNQIFNDVITIDLPTVDDTTLPSQLPPIFMFKNETGGDTGKYQIYSHGDGWEMAFENITNNGHLNFMYNYGFVYRGQSGDIISFECYYGDAYGSTIPICLTFEQGDAFFDGLLDISDLQIMINYIFNSLTNNDVFNFTAADLWTDNKINVQDIVKEVDILLDQPIPTSDVKARVPKHILARLPEAQASLRFADGQLLLQTETPVAAMDITVSNDAVVDWSDLERLGFTVTKRSVTDGTHIIAYSMSGAEVPVGETTIATSTSDQSQVVAAKMTDIAARAIAVKLNSQITTDINSVEHAEPSEVVYDLTGREIVNSKSSSRKLPKGIYIVDGHKVILK